MKVLVAIDLVLDVVLARAPWVHDAAMLLSASEEGRIEGYVAGHTVMKVHDVVAKEQGRQAAATAVTDLLRIVGIVPVSVADFQQALVLELDDFEDAVQTAAAMKIGADFLITRNSDDFQGIPIPIRTAGEILAML